MKKVFRIDKALVKSFERTPAGFIQTPAFLTRAGVFTYRKADGSIMRELRHPDDIFNPDSLKTLKGIPVTNDHPTRLVDLSNVKALAVGYVGDTIEREGDFLKANTITIFDDKTIKDIESGKVELSCGYESEIEETPGEYNGEAYDVRQRNIVYNHVSVVDEGRAGPQVRLRLDSNDAILETIADKFFISKGENRMEKIMIGGVEYEATPELKAALDKYIAEMQAKNDEYTKLKNDMEEANKKQQALQGKVDETQAKLDSALEENKKIKLDSTDAKLINALAEEKMKVISVGGFVLGKEFKFDGLTNTEIKKKVLEKKGVDVSSKSEVYIEARYDALAETIAEEMKAIKTFGEAVIVRHDSIKSSEDARKESMERSKNLWKTTK